MNTNYQETADMLTELVLDRYYGKFRGIVTDNNDPANQGRLKVKVPSVLKEQEVWAIACTPFGGKSMGFFMIPEKETGVWVEFEKGNPSLPIWTGCYWADKESPKDSSPAEPKVRMIRSEKGLTVSLDDEKEVVTIRDKNSSNIITIDAKGTIKIKSSSSVILESGTIKLGGESAVQPVVLGFELLSYLTQLATVVGGKPPTTPPLLPMNILSNKVKTV